MGVGLGVGVGLVKEMGVGLGKEMGLKLPGPKMIFIVGGTCRMGWLSDVITVRDFWMDETPVTVAQYREAVEAGAVSAPAGLDRDIWSNWGAEGREDHPVNCVSWYQACAYAKWAGKRLPSEFEWEWAARGGAEGRTYPWGGRGAPPPRDQLCWSGPGNDLGKGNRFMTSPVGSYPKGDSKHGLKDLAGNVWEWTSSPYMENLKRYIIRGGSWSVVDPKQVTTRHFGSIDAIYDHSDLGFRCVKGV